MPQLSMWALVSTRCPDHIGHLENALGIPLEEPLVNLLHNGVYQGTLYLKDEIQGWECDFCKGECSVIGFQYVVKNDESFELITERSF